MGAVPALLKSNGVPVAVSLNWILLSSTTPTFTVSPEVSPEGVNASATACASPAAFVAALVLF